MTAVLISGDERSSAALLAAVTLRSIDTQSHHVPVLIDNAWKGLAARTIV